MVSMIFSMPINRYQTRSAKRAGSQVDKNVRAFAKAMEFLKKIGQQVDRGLKAEDIMAQKERDYFGAGRESVVQMLTGG